MPKKLVLDRELSIAITNSQIVTIPTGEIWKLSISGDVDINEVRITGAFKETIPNGLFTGGCKIKLTGQSSYSNKAFLSGLAFKLQEV